MSSFLRGIQASPRALTRREPVAMLGDMQAVDTRVETRVFEGEAVARRTSLDEYDRLIAEGFFRDERVELLHGIVVRMSPSAPTHEDVVDRLGRLLTTALGARARIRIQNSFAAHGGSAPQPDIAVVEERSYAGGRPSKAFLVIEVAESSLNYDREIKAPLYGASEIPEYWIVDVVGEAIEVYTAPVDGRYSKMARVTTSVSPGAFPDLAVAVTSLFD